jgi:hypothetical protein
LILLIIKLAMQGDSNSLSRIIPRPSRFLILNQRRDMASIPEDQEMNNSIELELPVAHYWCHACQRKESYDPHDLEIA